MIFIFYRYKLVGFLGFLVFKLFENGFCIFFFGLYCDLVFVMGLEIKWGGGVMILGVIIEFFM